MTDSVKISQFLAWGAAAIPSDGKLTFVYSGTNYTQTYANFLSNLGVTGTIVQDGAVTGTPVLDTAGTINNIRNIEDGSGIKTSVSPENGITIEHNFLEDTTGVELITDLAVAQPKFRSLQSGTGINISSSGDIIQIALSGTPASTKTVIVNDIGDFPTAVSGVITLNNNTEYAVRNDISTVNRFVLGNNTVLSGSDNLTTTLTYTGTGVMFTSVNKNWTIKNLSIVFATGTMFDFDGSGIEIFQSLSCKLTGATLGTINDVAGIHMDDNQIILTVDGILFGGANGVILLESNLATIAAGTMYDLGVATFNGFSVTEAFATLNGTSVFLSGAASSANINVGGLGSVHNSRFYGAGTTLQTISNADIRWRFDINNGIADTSKDCLMSQITNAVNTVITVATTPVKLAGVWTEEDAFFFTTDTTGKMTFVGEKPAEFDVAMSFSAAPVSGSNKSINFYVAKNGTYIPNSRAYNNLSAGDVGRTTLVWRVSLTTGDYIESYVANNTDTIDVLVVDAVMRLS